MWCEAVSDVVIRAEGLGKKYLIGHQTEHEPYSSLRDVIAKTVRGFARSAGDMIRGRQLVVGDEIEEFWAVRNVNFEIRRGEVVGIIGRNGAGKSTLLKILSRITEPSTGRVEIKGRVASLLEVGTGFHPELTGRENIYLNGAILGMSRAEIRKKFDAIVAFAGVEGFLDTPVKRYSSGMYVRLAFAVAAHLEPEILVIDEVLAVGDAEFQKKCLGKIETIASSGRTVLFVSHNLRSISDLCAAAILLERGAVAAAGHPRDVVSRYIGGGTENVTEWRPQPLPNSPFQFNRVHLANARRGEAEATIPYSEAVEIEFDFTVNDGLPIGRLGLMLVNEEGLPVLTSADTDAMSNLNRPWPLGRFLLRCTIPGSLLMPGRYCLICSEPQPRGGDIIHENVLSFTINGLGSPSERDGRRGVIAPTLRWERLRISGCIGA
jgi:lipopolysaccharide transport system ATP-binding protein